jgi:methyltransferase
VPLLAALIFTFMLLEARRASRNERAQRARGGIEPPDDVYRVMQVVYPAAFLAMLLEGAWRVGPPAAVFAAGALVFAAAKALKWWAILTLRRCWTFRVIVVPGALRIRHGPYRLLSHPNYVAVVGELAGVALMTGALVAGPIATAGFAVLIRKRITVEERALRVLT